MIFFSLSTAHDSSLVCLSDRENQIKCFAEIMRNVPVCIVRELGLQNRDLAIMPSLECSVRFLFGECLLFQHFLWYCKFDFICQTKRELICFLIYFNEFWRDLWLENVLVLWSWRCLNVEMSQIVALLLVSYWCLYLSWMCSTMCMCDIIC